jgi:RecJ-like exonuclease
MMETVTCPQCEGWGSLMINDEEIPCPLCNGTGEISEGDLHICELLDPQEIYEQYKDSQVDVKVGLILAK